MSVVIDHLMRSFGFEVAVREFFRPLQAGARLALARPEGHKRPDYLANLI
jgi:hypothetical protein